MKPNSDEFRLSSSIRDALDALYRSGLYAKDLDCDRWDFAIEMDRLLTLGLSKCELRWLLAKGYLECAREADSDRHGVRSFSDVGNRVLVGETCFVLSFTGEQRVHDLIERGQSLSLVVLPTTAIVNPDALVRPCWNRQRRTLKVGDAIVKHYRVPAGNQEVILDTLEEDGWPDRIDDPLTPFPQQDPKRRLQSAIMCLNRNQRLPLLRFRGDGSGTGILWEHVACPA